MQPSSPSARLSTDELDVVTADLSRRVRAGTLPEPDARMAIYEAVFKTDIIRSETLRWCRKHSIAMHLHEEMVDAADGFYMRKILDLPTEQQAAAADEDQPVDSTGRNGKKFFDLEVFADGASAAGSIRQALSDYTLMGRTLLRSVNRVRRSGQVITSTDLLEGNVEEGDPHAYLVHELPASADAAVAAVLDDGREARLEQIYDRHLEAVNGQRGAARTQVDAMTLRQAFALPELERPLDPHLRTRMLRWLDTDPELALRSIVAFFVPDADPRVAALGRLWSDYTDENLEAVSTHDYGASIAELLVREALADHPRPGKPAVARLRAEVKRAVSGLGLAPSWGAKLVDIFLTHEHEERSAWDVERTSLRLARHPQAYLEALGKAALLPGAPLGESPAEVRRTLAQMVLDARESTSARRSARAA